MSGVIVHPKLDSLDVESFSEKNIEMKTLDDTNFWQNAQASKVNLIISSFLFGSGTELRNQLDSLRSLLREKGFLIFYHRDRILSEESVISSLCKRKLQVQSHKTLERIFEERNLSIISKFTDSYGSNLYLLRNIVDDEKKEQSIVRIGNGNYEHCVNSLKEAMNESCKSSSKVWLVSEDSYSGVVGMTNCLLNEIGGKNVRCLLLITDESSKAPPPFDFEDPFYAHILKKDLVFNVFYNEWGSFRHISLDQDLAQKIVPYSYMDITKYGDLSSFKWFEAPYSYEVSEPEDTQDIVHVVYSALNFKDVMYASGKLNAGTAKDEVGNDHCVIGLEFSGVRADGRRVMGICSNRGIATMVNRPLMIYEVPDHWTLEDAATVPVVYSTCYYALIIKGRLSPGETVLIHSGAGGIGLAAIRIAFSLRCEVFTTVGTPAKTAYLKKLFPDLKDQNIGCSRNTSFEYMIQTQTNGRGVDVVLNSLADDKLQSSTRCLAEGGRFVEIGKYDLNLDNKIGLSMFLKGASFHGVFLGKQVTKYDSKKIAELLRDGIQKGVVQPLDRSVFPDTKVEQAFRFMATGNHKGKVLLKLSDEPQRNDKMQKQLRFALPKAYLYSNKVYIVIGGFGGFGMALVRWLIEKGAKSIIITTRQGVRIGYQKLQLRRWQAMGADVRVSQLNVGKKKEAGMLISLASSIGPIGGIFNSAVVLNDSFWENLDPYNFREVCLPKVEATLYLDELTRQHCPFLDHFVCFSSISCGKGNAGQSNYGYANSVMERVCEKRHRDNLPGLAIQWGIIGDVGIVHRNMGEDAVIAGVTAQPIKSCLETLEHFMLLNHPVVSSYVNANIQIDQGKKEDFMSIIAKSIGFSNSMDIDVTKAFGELGIDSITGVEIITTIENHYGLTLTIREMQEMKVYELKERLESLESADIAQATNKVSSLNIRVGSVFGEQAIVTLNDCPQGDPVIFIHYSMSHIEKFRAIATSLRNPCYAIMCTKNASFKTIDEIVDFYVKTISAITNKALHMVAYSDAASLAYEITARTETVPGLPTIQSVCFLNGTLQFAKTLANEYSSIDSIKLEIESLFEFLKPFCCPGNSEKVKSELETTYSKQKLRCLDNICSTDLNCISGNVLAESAKKWIHINSLMRALSSSRKILNGLVAFETTENFLSNDVAFVKSEIGKVFHNEIKIHRLPGNDNVFPTKEQADLIASTLDKYYKTFDKS